MSIAVPTTVHKELEFWEFLKFGETQVVDRYAPLYVKDRLKNKRLQMKAVFVCSL